MPDYAHETCLSCIHTHENCGHLLPTLNSNAFVNYSRFDTHNLISFWNFDFVRDRILYCSQLQSCRSRRYISATMERVRSVYSRLCTSHSCSNNFREDEKSTNSCVGAFVAGMLRHDVSFYMSCTIICGCELLWHHIHHRIINFRETNVTVTPCSLYHVFLWDNYFHLEASTKL